MPFELVSIKPPLPPCEPPMAFKMPATFVCICDQILICPPLPFLTDEASTKAFCSTVTVLAKFSALRFERVPSAF